MKKWKWFLLFGVLLFIFNMLFPLPIRTYTDGLVDYQLMSNGSYKANDYTYKYRLEITGRMNTAVKDSTFIYLSNIAEITFDRAWKGAGFSSVTTDYFEESEAILVDRK